MKFQYFMIYFSTVFNKIMGDNSFNLDLFIRVFGLLQEMLVIFMKLLKTAKK